MSWAWVRGAIRAGAAVRPDPLVPKDRQDRQALRDHLGPNRAHGPKDFRDHPVPRARRASHDSCSSPSCCPSPDPRTPLGTIAGTAQAARKRRRRRPHPPDPRWRLRRKSLQLNAESFSQA
ncbi:hypothetical protein NJB14197_42390 [Mycobacterium montefiorense]|uniref:Uncharacterized protein n=1 Tax=Mycobacterium montefiorense TaxID=154654 RepID=A0AA37PN78_9MYCO|nr:hypothetical protein MmonteBS_18830 [Mycobacterium montefiorense]GKU35350.1 hypothetical protein NJB14191_26960 [Mycobacterium montefiorense]GKU42368.1 hypothetical protein NJB14192_43510 [Mycobacterium montefiorense]GKU47809.1 hypothetical protein NJB14194_44270 [Mycobacterium montefiorense]GKU52802.1 hypothetical protein NJB14195_40430 [Mycobacterium montefiorense]